MKGCSSNSGTVYLSLGSFFRHIKMNYFAASLTFVALENFISSSTFHNKIKITILIKSLSVVISKGTLPKSSS